MKCNSELLRVEKVISGEDFASSFGYSLATADINGDGFQVSCYFEIVHLLSLILKVNLGRTFLLAPHSFIISTTTSQNSAVQFISI